MVSDRDQTSGVRMIADTYWGVTMHNAHRFRIALPRLQQAHVVTAPSNHETCCQFGHSCKCRIWRDSVQTPPHGLEDAFESSGDRCGIRYGTVTGGATKLGSFSSFSLQGIQRFRCNLLSIL